MIFISCSYTYLLSYLRSWKQLDSYGCWYGGYKRETGDSPLVGQAFYRCTRSSPVFRWQCVHGLLPGVCDGVKRGRQPMTGLCNADLPQWSVRKWDALVNSLERHLVPLLTFELAVHQTWSLIWLMMLLKKWEERTKKIKSSYYTFLFYHCSFEDMWDEVIWTRW